MEYHSVLSPAEPPGPERRQRREVRSAPPLVWDIRADSNRGTNIRHVALDRTRTKQGPKAGAPPDGVLPRELSGSSAEVRLLMVTGGVVVGLLTLGLVAFAAVTCRGKTGARRKDAPRGSGSREPMVAPPGRGDSSEV